MGIKERIDNITHLSEDYMQAKPPCPKSVKIELTGRCNYRCGFCALRMRDCQPKRKDDMSLEFFKDITRDMYESGVEEIGVFYLGESLMAADLTIEAVQYLKQMGMPYVFLTTNGSLATRSVLNALFAAGLDSLKFSINAADFEQFEEVMGVKSHLYQKALDAVRIAREEKDAGGWKCGLYASSIQYDGQQQEKMAGLIREFVEPYVDEHYYLPLYSMGSVATQREKELGYRPTAGNQGRIGGLVKPLPCWSAFSEGHVRSDGVVSLCCFDADGRFQVGNLHTDDWMTVWHNEAFTRIRDAHLREDLKGTVCEECVAY
jgi:MoaA/NifB/PqqE/SkfB family radical SAM enzyme